MATTYDATGYVEQTIGGLIVHHLATGERVTSGSGLYQPFLHQDSNGPLSIGYNSDESGNPLDVGSSQTEALLLSNIPIIYRAGVAYYEFRLDVNEPNNDNRQVALEQLRIYTSAREASLADYNNGFTAAGVFTTVYNLDAGEDRRVLLSDDSTGGGTDDYAFYIPVSAFSGDPATTFVTFVSQFGPNPDEDGGFEEWRTQDAASINGIKFADLDGDGVKDANEAGIAGFTVYIDANNNNILDNGEISTVSGAGGVFHFYGLPVGEVAATVIVREALTPAQQADWLLTTGDASGDHAVTYSAVQAYAVAVGNMPIIKAITVDKTVASITGGTPGGKADSAGDVIHYSISLANAGNVPLTNVTLTDPNADAGSITYVSGDGGVAGVLEVGETWIFSATHLVTQAELDSNGGGDGDIDNTATGSAFYNAAEVQDDDSAAAELVYNPLLAIEKDFVDVTNSDQTKSSEADKPGDVINYHITVENTGNITLTGVTVTDPAADPGSIQRIIPVQPSALDDGDALLEIDEIWTYSATHTVTQAELDAKGNGTGVFVNTATADSTESPPDSDDAQTPLVYDPLLAIEKDFVDVTNSDQTKSDKADKAGDVISYHITVENTGNITLTGVTVTDPAADPGSIQRVIPVQPSALDDGDALLEVDEIWTYSATHTVTQAELDAKGDGTGVFVNTATADSTESPPDDDDAETPLVYDPLLAIEKDFVDVTNSDQTKSSEADKAGDVINYHITVENTGNITLTGVTVTDPAADPGSIQRVIPVQPSALDDGDDLLEVDETWTYSTTHTVTQAELDAKGDGTGVFVNTATADSTESPPDDDDAETPLVYDPLLAIEKDFVDVTNSDQTKSDKADKAGDVINYHITVENTGNITLTGVTVTDPAADPGSIQRIIPVQPSALDDGDALLEVDEIWTYSATHTVTQAELEAKGDGTGVFVNTATADSTESPPDSDDAETPLVYDPLLAIEKDFVDVTNADQTKSDKADKAGDIINYVLTVENTGNITLTGVTVTDPAADPGSIQRIIPVQPSALDDGDALLEVDEIWTYSATHTVTQAELDAKGDGTGVFVNTATADSTESPPDSDDAETPLVYDPLLAIEKDFVNVTNADQTTSNSADKAGDVINYHITVENTGNVTLTGVTVTDPAADPNSIQRVIPVQPSALDDGDNLLEVDEIWTYSATHTVTQAELNAKGNGSGVFVNTATADSTESPPDSDDAQTPLVYNPKVDLEKYVSVDGGTTFFDADNPTGPTTSLNAPVIFRITVANTGNVTLTSIALTDTKYNLTGVPLYLDADKDSVLDAGETTIVTSLAPGEQGILLYTLPYETGQHVNTASVTTGQNATDSDAAHYFGLVNDGPGVRTPGFWSNLGFGFWDGKVGLPKQAGQPGFADHELLYAVDSDRNGSIGAGDQAGFLLGDFDMNGLTNGGEDTIFIPLALAQQLIDASQKDQQDGRWMLGRDTVATWLNYLAGNNIGEANDPNSPKALLQDAVDWFQTYADANHDNIMDLAKANAIKTSDAKWSAPGDGGYGAFVSAASMHNQLDAYNNTGSTSPGHDYAGDADSAVFLFALANIV